MGFNNKYFITPYSGLGLDLYWETIPFTDGAYGQYTKSAKGVGNFEPLIGNPHMKYAILSVGGRGVIGEQGKPIFVKDEENFIVTSNLNVNNDEKLNKTSLVDIIQYLQGWDSTFVDFADFAYLKNLGVYPTNRLMIARRFSVPTQNNLYKIKDKPMATLVSWVPDDTDFLSISFGENWVGTNETSFTDVFSDAFDDLGPLNPFKKGKAGESASKGFNITQFPGITEYIQATVREKLGLNEDDPEYSRFNPPSGNPNLIKEGSRRATTGTEDASRPFSGLEGKFAISFSTEYELKFVNGVDPSLVYLDIIRNSLVFGTSKSVNVLGVDVETSFAKTLNGLLNGDFESVQKTLTAVIDGISEALKNSADKWLEEQKKKRQTPPPPPIPGEEPEATSVRLFKDLLGDLTQFQFSKYRIRLLSIIQVMTGAPSAYWHITIGNPKKPIFCSGDMVCGNVTMKFGKVLSYNDLPSTIQIDFTLTSARNLGGQEIFDRLNTGQGRTYFNERRAYYEQFFGATQTSTGITITKTRKDKFIEYTQDKIGTKERENPGPGQGT
jgi:hypothetical protein